LDWIIAFDDYNHAPGIIPVQVSSHLVGCPAISGQFMYHEGVEIGGPITGPAIAIDAWSTPMTLLDGVIIKSIYSTSPPVSASSTMTSTNLIELGFGRVFAGGNQVGNAQNPLRNRVPPVGGTQVGTTTYSVYVDSLSNGAVQTQTSTRWAITASKTIFDASSVADTITFTSTHGGTWKPKLLRAIHQSTPNTRDQYSLFAQDQYDHLFTTSDNITYTLTIPTDFDAAGKFFVVAGTPYPGFELSYACSAIFHGIAGIRDLGGQGPTSGTFTNTAITFNSGSIEYRI
jgi:hypothetical protein